MNTASDTKRLSWELPEAIWQRMEACIPPKRGKEGHPRTVNLRRITEGNLLRPADRHPVASLSTGALRPA